MASATDDSPGLRRALGVADLAVFNLVVVFSLRGIATAAKMGPLVLVLWLFAVAAFFVPLGLAVAEMGSRDPEEGGFYRWTRSAFGDAHGFLAGWSYWLSNLTYLPSQLLFLAANLAVVAGAPGSAEAPCFVTPVGLGVLALATWIAVRGFGKGRGVARAGALAAVAAVLLLVAVATAATAAHGSAFRFDVSLPDSPRALGWFGTLAFALVGLELAPLLGGEIRDPRRTVPRAIAIGGLAILVLYVAGTAAVLVALPADEVSPITGVASAVAAMAARVGWPVLEPLVACLLCVAVFAGFAAWLGAMARLPYAIGLDRFLPARFARLDPVHGTPRFAILLQAAATAVLLLACQAGATVREAFLLLVDATIVLNFVPFLYLFAALPRLRPRGAEPGVVRIPGGRKGLVAVSATGLLATVLTLASAVVPPEDAGSVAAFEARLLGGLLVCALAGLLVFRRGHRV